MNTIKPLLTKTQKAREIQVSTKTIDRMVKQGKVKYVEVSPKLNRKQKWYFSKDEDTEWLNNYYLGGTNDTERI